MLHAKPFLGRALWIHGVSSLQVCQGTSGAWIWSRKTINLLI